MKKFHYYLLAALSFIILLCLEDAQGQFSPRSSSKLLQRFQRRKTRAHRDQISTPAKKNNVESMIDDTSPGDRLTNVDRMDDDMEEAESVSYLDFVRPPGSQFNKEALLVISDQDHGSIERIDPGKWFKIDSVYPLFPPGTKPIQHQKRPRRQHPPRALNYSPYVNPYTGPKPDYTKPPYVAPKPYQSSKPYQLVPQSAYAPVEHKPFSFPTNKPVPKPTQPYLPPVTPQYQNPPPSYDDHLPYQLHPEKEYEHHEEHKDLHPQPYTPKPYVPDHKAYTPKPHVYKPTPKPYEPTPKPYDHSPRPYDYSPKPYDHSPRPHDYSPKPYDHTPKPYEPTPKPYEPVHKPHEHAPEPYTPRPNGYSIKPYIHTPRPYEPTPKPYEPVHEVHEPTPQPYDHTPKVYGYSLQPHSPTPRPYEPTPKPYAPTPYAPTPKPHHEQAEVYRHPAHQYPDEEPKPTSPKTYVQHFGHHPTTPQPYHPHHGSPKPDYHEPEEHYEPPARPYPEYSPYKPAVGPYEPVHQHFDPPQYEEPKHHNHKPEYHEPEYHEPEYHEPEYHEPEYHEPDYYHPTPKPYAPTPKPHLPESYSPTPKAYAPTPKPYSPTTKAYSPTPPPYSPTPKPYSPTPKPYSPTPEPYSPSPAPYSPTPKPYSPTPKPYSPTPKPYSPTPQPVEVYEPTPKPYVPTPPEVYDPTPKPYDPILQPYKPEPEPYKPKPEPYQPYHPEDSYYDDGNKYQHFPVVEAVPAHPPKAPTGYRLPKKQEFSNFPAYNNPYNDFDEQGLLDPAHLPEKRKVESGSNSFSNNNFVTPKSVKSKPNRNKERQPVDPLDQLKAIAGVKDGANGDLVPKDKPFVCPSDGHFGDPNDCTKFYKCAHGTPVIEYCPATLFWNQATEQCDWPEQSLCQFDPNAVQAKALNEKTFLYLTFDDGPNEGTEFVLDALADSNVPATFFINSDNMYDPKTEKAEANQRTLLKVVDGGHVLADHSFDHMNHNSNDSPKNAYTNVEQDLQYFGLMNSEPVMDLMWSNGRRDVMNFANFTLNNFVRMPYTNNWRLPALRIVHDCSRCTIPASSGQRGIEISNRLADQGKRVIGWDDEWGVEWTTNTLKYGGAAAYQRLNRRHTKSPQKVVLLMHDIAFRNPQASEELRTFVRLAKDSGYIFSTIDQYETDSL